jgi:hypothetical protein
MNQMRNLNERMGQAAAQPNNPLAGFFNMAQPLLNNVLGSGENMNRPINQIVPVQDEEEEPESLFMQLTS